MIFFENVLLSFNVYEKIPILIKDHTGLKHMLFKFKFKYYHLQERAMIHKYLRNCDVCLILKGRVDVPIKLQTAPIAKQPLETDAIDFVGPLVQTDGGNRVDLLY